MVWHDLNPTRGCGRLDIAVLGTLGGLRGVGDNDGSNAMSLIRTKDEGIQERSTVCELML